MPTYEGCGFPFCGDAESTEEPICYLYTPQPTSTPTNTWVPGSQGYYEQFEGLAFWIIYNETSQDSVQDQFEIVETAARNAARDDPNRIVLRPNPDDFPLSRREVRYLFARTILQSIPAFTLGSEEAGYAAGLAYGRNWKGSINDTTDDLWIDYAGCPDTHNHNYAGGTLPSHSAIYSAPALQVLHWFSDYASCRATRNSDIQTSYTRLTAVIETATEDILSNSPNPVSGAYNIRNANTCFVSDSGGGCLLTRDIDAWCEAAGQNRNCRSYLRYREEGSLGAVGVTASQWFEYADYHDDHGVPPTYRLPIPNPGSLVFNEYYLLNPDDIEDIPQQITYNTQVGVHYYISTGLYDTDTQSLYLLMGIGSSGFSETLTDAFYRHWNRLNRDRSPTNPETYDPSGCVYAMAHATLGQGAFQTWTTFTFQSAGQGSGGDVWFCQ